MAYADDDLNASEASLVNNFCRAIGVYPDQLEKLRGEVLASLKKQGQICPSCEGSADAEARFCPKCGASLTSLRRIDSKLG